MQDNYVGDIGDYGKYGMLREVCAEKLSLAVNWYKVVPRKVGKQDDGKYTNYLSNPNLYRDYDPELFDSLSKIVNKEKDRHIERIEAENIFRAKFYSEPITSNRTNWHNAALIQTIDSDVVFLDPDNGLETANMYKKGIISEKHVKWQELKDYYTRGQNVILYQHRPQMAKKEMCIDGIISFQKKFLMADRVKLLEFPKYTNRFYFMFLHDKFASSFENVCKNVIETWGKNDFCKEIVVG